MMRDFVKKCRGNVEENTIILIIDSEADKIRTLTEEFENQQVITNTVEDFDSDNIRTIHIPKVFTDTEGRIRFAIATLIEKDVVEFGDEIFVVSTLPDLSEDMVTQVTVKEEYESSDMIRFFLESQASTETIYETLSLAISLARNGRKGSPIGALFIVGDENEVLERSKPLNYNPFSGTDVHVKDEVVSASIGEFAKLDGAFVISSNGEVVSSSRYLEPEIKNAEVPSGLGSRHMAASGISKSTDAISIVVSESDERIRCFMDGELVIDMDPNESPFIY
jgi:diadenylate cyclase